MKILIAEDSLTMRNVIKGMLGKANYKNIIEASDGREVVTIMNKSPVDLVLLDINMPKLNGFETTQRIRLIHKDIPIIAQTALNIDEAKEKAEQAGCNDYILKPIRLKLFLSKLDSYLTK